MNITVTPYDKVSMEHVDLALDCMRQQTEQAMHGTCDEGPGCECCLNGPQVKRRKKTSIEQFKVLDRAFSENPRPSSDVRQLLAQKLDMTIRGVQVWFQNRRAKMKRMHGGQGISAGNKVPAKVPFRKVKPATLKRSKPVTVACARPPPPLHPLLSIGERREIVPWTPEYVLPSVPRCEFPIGQSDLASAERAAGRPLSPLVVLSDQPQQYFAIQIDTSGFVAPDPNSTLNSYDCVIDQQPPDMPPLIPPPPSIFPYFPLRKDIPASLISFVEQTATLRAEMLHTAQTHYVPDGLHAGIDFHLYGCPDALGIYTREETGLICGQGYFPPAFPWHEINVQ